MHAAPHPRFGTAGPFGLGLLVAFVLAVVAVSTGGQVEGSHSLVRILVETLLWVGVVGLPLGVVFVLVARLVAPPPSVSALELAGAFFVGATGLFLVIVYGNGPQIGPGFGGMLLAIGAMPLGGVAAFTAWTILTALRRHVTGTAVVSGLAAGSVAMITWLVALVQLSHIAAGS
jgi:hypothetical protein